MCGTACPHQRKPRSAQVQLQKDSLKQDGLMFSASGGFELLYIGL
jgi:hypothetical protein